MGGEATLPTEHWKDLDDSVNAISFGFVATAILISMFLLLAIFERFLRQRSTESSVPTTPLDLEHQVDFGGGKLESPSPKLDDNLWERRISVDARPEDSYIHCTSCISSTMLSRAKVMAYPT